MVGRSSFTRSNARWAVERARDAYREGGLRQIVGKGMTFLDKQRVPGVGFGPVPGTASVPGAVVMFADPDPPQCWHYRVEQKREACRALGVPFMVVQSSSIDEVLSAVQLAALLIVYRQPANPPLSAVLAEAARLGVPTLYEVDDIVYAPRLVAANPNLDTLPSDLRSAVVRGASDYLAAMRRCAGGLASTTPLADDMARHVPGPVMVVENGIDAESEAIARGIDDDRAAGRLRGVDGHVIIGYGSGSRAHDHDLEIAAPALARILAESPEVRLRLLGPLALPGVLAPFTDRVDRVPLLPHGEFLWELAHCDIAIAPLADIEFNRFKSQVKYLEAGLLGQAFVASDVVYGAYVEDGRTGLIARDDAEWYAALRLLVDDPVRRQALGVAAREHVTRWRVADLPAAQLAGVLDAVGARVG